MISFHLPVADRYMSIGYFGGYLVFTIDRSLGHLGGLTLSMSQIAL